MYLCSQMGHKKLKKFQAILTYNNVLQFPENMKGNWHQHFGNNNPITLELACGKGEYSVGLGRTHTDRNFIGVDIKGNRIYTGAKIAIEEGLSNVAFLRTHISHITKYFAPGEVAEIWIIFPDPFLKKESNRLTHARYLYLFEQILKTGAKINLKTDSLELYEFTVATVAEQGCVVHENLQDIYGNNLVKGPLAIQTFYEKMHLADGRKIYFISFSLPENGVQLTGRFAKMTADGEEQESEEEGA